MQYILYLVIIGIVALEIVYDEEIARRKAPDVACPRTIRIGAVEFVNSPLVGRI